MAWGCNLSIGWAYPSRFFFKKSWATIMVPNFSLIKKMLGTNSFSFIKNVQLHISIGQFSCIESNTGN